MRPTIITLAIYFEMPLTLTTVFMAIGYIDWIAWPLHMLPHFSRKFKESMRGMRRIQKYLLLDETQEGLVKQQDNAWGKTSVEIKGNFSWGFINKQEDEESEDEDKNED